MLSMYNSIQHFQTKMVEKLEKIFITYSSDMTKIAELIEGVTHCVLELGTSMIAEELEQYDTFLCNHSSCRLNWYIVRKDKTTLLTSLGVVSYQKTLFRHKKTGEYSYLLDRVMKLESHARMTEDAETRILEEAVQTTYEKGGKQISFSREEVSKETVKNKIHALKFPKKRNYPERKKVVEYLYIDADEDHISLQFREEKGDIVKNNYHQKNNGAIAKLIYVYEGIEAESEKSKRNRLINPYYFCRVCEGEENKRLWDEVYEYMEHTYDLKQVKKIYLNADGGSWIRSGMRRIAGITYVLDEFHLSKYLKKITTYLGKEAEATKEELKKIIRRKSKKEFEEKIEEIKQKMKSSKKKEKIEEGKRYLFNNYTAAKRRLLRKDGVKGSSTESHVSHVLSSRMSSRPMGWSKKGMEKMAQLRAYYYNGGSMLDLVRYQKEQEELSIACEEVIYRSNEMFAMERKRKKELGNLADIPTYSIPYVQIKKIAHFKNQICGL